MISLLGNITVRFLVVATVLFAVSAPAQAAKQLYRYINESGVMVINGNIPPEFVSKGYDIILADGTLLSRVPRQLSEDELRLRNTDESRARLKQEDAERMKAWDESLLLRYSSIEDIEAAQLRAMRDLQIRISIQKSNLITIKSQIEREQQKAADIERRGAEVPAGLLKNIDTMRLEIEDTEQSIAVRNEEIKTVKASYMRDIERFKTLLHRVEMRRQQSQPSSSRSKSYY
ncbi:MAG: hypothetical protein WCY88_10095 [Spongiibacteraceae bacterium]